MQELKAGQIICSMAGHDKGQFYIIIGVENEYVFLVDGKYKTLLNINDIEVDTCENNA